MTAAKRGRRRSFVPPDPVDAELVEEMITSSTTTTDPRILAQVREWFGTMFRWARRANVSHEELVELLRSKTVCEVLDFLSEKLEAARKRVQ